MIPARVRNDHRPTGNRRHRRAISAGRNEHARKSRTPAAHSSEER